MAQSRLLALAILISSQKPVHVRSLHFHNEERMEISSTFYTVQQDFLFDPGSYTRTGEPIVVRGSDGRIGVKRAIGAHVRALQSEGWLPVLEYKAGCPLDPEAMPDFLTPSKNGDLRNIPSLTQDLILVERASKANEEAYIGGMRKLYGWSSPSLTLCPLGQPFPTDGGPFSYRTQTQSQTYCHNSLPSLTPCPSGTNKHRWGCDLELASPKVLELASPKSPPTHQGSPKSLSSSSKQDHRALLDLNLDISDSLLEHNNEGEDFSSPQSLTMSNETCYTVECFAPDSPMCHDKAFVYPRAKTKQLTPSSSSDESNTNTNSNTTFNINANANGSASTNAFGSHLESELNSNSCTASSSILSAARISNMIGLTSEKASQESPATSTDHSWKDESITQSWNTPPLSNGEINVNRTRIRSNSTSERITEITLHELSQYFHMPITQASKELKVGLTVLKKRCREFGIPRWPHRKMKSLESLIINIQDLAKDQGVKSSERVANAVKELEEQKKLMEEMPGTELAERTKRLRQACFKANYKKRRLIGPQQCAISTPPTKVPIPPFCNQSSIILDFERGSSHHIGFL